MHKSNGAIRLSATDLANHLACRHLTGLNHRAAEGLLEKPIRRDAILETLIERGLEHEKVYVDHLRSLGKSIRESNYVSGAPSLLSPAALRAVRQLPKYRRAAETNADSSLRASM